MGLARRRRRRAHISVRVFHQRNRLVTPPLQPTGEQGDALAGARKVSRTGQSLCGNVPAHPLAVVSLAAVLERNYFLRHFLRRMCGADPGEAGLSGFDVFHRLRQREADLVDLSRTQSLSGLRSYARSAVVELFQVFELGFESCMHLEGKVQLFHAVWVGCKISQLSSHHPAAFQSPKNRKPPFRSNFDFSRRSFLVSKRLIFAVTN